MICLRALHPILSDKSVGIMFALCLGQGAWVQDKKQKVLKPLRFQDFYWSEWRDLNSRPLDPQSSALPTALHPDVYFLLLRIGDSLVILTRPKTKCKPFFHFFQKFF